MLTYIYIFGGGNFQDFTLDSRAEISVYLNFVSGYVIYYMFYYRILPYGIFLKNFPIVNLAKKNPGRVEKMS